MKKLNCFLIVMVAVFTTVSADAQRPVKGNVALEVSGGLISIADIPVIFRVSPAVDFFLKDNVSLGVGLDLAGVSGVWGYMLTPRLAFHIPLAERVSISLTTGLNIGQFFDGGWSTYTLAGISFKPAINYYINKRWMIKASIGNFGVGLLTEKYEDYDGRTSKDNRGYFRLNWNRVNLGVGFCF